MNKLTAGIVGFLVAPLVAALMATILTPIEGRINLDPASLTGLLPIFFLYAAAATVLLALPLFLVLLHYGAVKWWTIFIGGIVVGTIVSMIITAPDWPGLRELVVAVSMGGASSLAFWLIWRLGR